MTSFPPLNLKKKKKSSTINISLATLNVIITNSTKINSYERLNQLINQILETVTHYLDLTYALLNKFLKLIDTTAKI